MQDPRLLRAGIHRFSHTATGSTFQYHVAIEFDPTGPAPIAYEVVKRFSDFDHLLMDL